MFSSNILLISYQPRTQGQPARFSKHIYTRRVLGVAYFCWEFCWANKPNGSAVMIHTLLRIYIELRMR